jgi:hypothetical protein
MRQLEALGHLQNRQGRNIFIGPIAEHLGQKQYILEDFSCAVLLPHSCHGSAPFKIKRRSIGYPMSAFAQRRRRRLREAKGATVMPGKS